MDERNPLEHAAGNDQAHQEAIRGNDRRWEEGSKGLLEELGDMFYSANNIFWEHRRKKALAKIEQMKGASHEEALRLESQHAKLEKDVADATKALKDFEEQQLGM